ncbi:neuroblast differentiation-associated protein AHNAK isoform X1 [Haplochromis burtoni]|uniref:neuroblast differentiation-associated protein AHNAK isoform X1 n=1 Tax=Haplochromis burtoni TaxID=8153 RepID=UPI0006C9E493|nr:neuroblast differentiation-associated protein AHNAK isoform X1 [Haplochromis burtoni]
MADEEETREVLFPDWEGADKTGMTIEQTSGGQLFVKEVKGESPAARSGKVYEGDQIVGATIYFENMSSEETAELLKTLNKHKVGLKLQNKGDKSPYYSPLSTPCRSPVSTLTWEGKTRFGDSSPDIILSGDDEDYKRIYTRKIKPRLKSEDLAEGVDVRTERHSSTSSDGSTITTITRRITTYTVDMPSGISEQLELSSPDVKGLRHESGDGSSHIRISHGSPSGKMGAEEGVFESGDITYTGPNITSTVTRWGNGGVQTTTHIGEEKERSDLRFKVPSFGVTGSKCHEGTETSRGSSEQGDESVQDSEMTVTLRDNKNTAGSHVTAGSGGAGIISTDENGGSGRLSLPGKGMKILTATTEKTQMGSSDSTLDERTKVKISGITISPLQTKGSGSTDIPHIRIGGSTDTSANLKDGRIEKSTITLDNVTSGLSSKKSELDIKGAGVQIKGPRANTEGSVLSVRHSESESDIGSAEINSNIQIKLPTTDSKYKMDVNVPSISGLNKVEGKGDLTGERKTAGLKFDIKGSNTDTERKEGTNAHVQIPEADIKAIKPSIDSKDVKIKGPSVDIKRTQVNVTVPAAEFGVPKAERLDVDLKLSKSKTDTKIPKVENKAGIKGEIKTHEIDVKGLEINLPRTGIDVKAPDFDITGPQVDTEDLDVNLKGSKIEPPSLSGTKLKDLDMSVKGPKMKGNVDVPNLERDIKTPKMKIEGKEIDSEGQTSGLIMSNIKMPSLCIKGPKPEGQDVNINLSKTEINVKAPEVDVSSSRGPKLEEFNNTVKGPKLKGDVTVSAPKIEGDLQAPKVDIEGRYVNIEGHKGGLKMPKVEMSSFGVKGPKVEGPDVDVNLPKGDIEMKAPNIDIKGADIDVEGPSGKIKGPQFKMSGISGPKVSMPDVDFNLKGPKVEGEVDIPKIEGKVKAPGPGVDIEGPKVDIEGPKGGFEMPKIKMPTFGFKGPKVEGPDVDIKLPKADVNIKAPEVDIRGPEIEGSDAKLKGPKFKLPSLSGPSLPDFDINLKGPKLKGDVDVSAPKIERDIKAPKVDIEGPDVDIEGHKGGLKMPKFKMPGFGMKGPKVEGPDVDVSLPKGEIDIKAPEVDIKGADIDVEGPSGKIKGPKFKMSGMSGPKISMPDVDFNLKGPKVEGEVDVPKIEGKVKAPGVDFEGPKVDIEGPKGGFEMPKIKMPTFGFKGPKVEGPDVDINLPKADFNVKGPEVDISGPEIEGPDAKLKGPKFKLPSLSGPSLPDFDINLKGPKLKGDVDVSVPKIEGDIKAPKVDIEGPDIDIEGHKGGLKMPKFKMPSFGMKGPKVEGPDVDVSLPKGDIDIKAPEVDIKGADFDIEGPSGKIKGPKFKMPGISGPKISMPDVDFNLKGPKVEGEVDVPKIEGRVKAPGVDISGPDLEDPDVKLKGPKFNLPSLSGPSLPDFDINLKGPKVKGDVSAPKVEGDIKGPKMDIQGPEIDIQGPKSALNMPSIKMPSFGLKGPKVEGPDADIHLPKADINVKTPKVDITVPEVECSYAKPKGPKMKLPSLSGPKLQGPDININIPKPNNEFKTSDIGIDLKGPKVKGEVDASVPMFESDIKGPNANISNDDEKTAVTFPKFKGPKFAMKTPVLEESKSNIKMPSTAPKSLKTEVSFPDTDASVDAPDIDINVKGKKGKFKLPKVKGKAKKPDVDIETPATEINADITNSYAKGTKTKKSRFGKLHFPDVELDIKSPKLKGDGSLSAIDGSGSHSANVNLEGSNMKVKSSNIKMQSGTDSEINASASGGGASGGLQYPEGKVTFTKITMPKFGIVLPQVETKESGGNIESEPAASVDIKTESPSIGCQVSSQNIEVPSPELRQEGKVKVKMPKIFGKSKAKGSSVGDLHGSEGELSSSGKAGKTSKELSVHSGEMMGGKIELEGDPGLGLSTKGKSASLDLFKKSRHRSSSFSDEGGVSSPSAQLEAEGGDISLDLGSKVKGKKGKLKFGTFGGFGSKSKGSYEVTLGDDSEARMEGSAGVSLPAKKSRLSSSSSSDSGSRGGFRFPKVELSVSPTK